MEDIPVQDRLLPKIVDIRAQKSPLRTYAILPIGDNLEDGFYDLTYAAFAKAVDAAAWWLDETLGKSSDEGVFPAVPYIGANDIRYALLAFACIKTHRKFLVLLPNNTVEAQVRLLQQENCVTALASKEQSHFWNGARATMDNLRVIEVPSLSHLLNDAQVSHYPYTKTLSQAAHDPAYAIQTSGTTGTPKPLPYSNLSILHSLTTPSPSGPQLAMPHLLSGAHFTNLLPLSWGAGLIAVTTWPILTSTLTIVMPPSMPQPMTASYALRALSTAPRGEKNGVVFVPDVLRSIVAGGAQNLEVLGRMDWVGFAGAPLDDETGDRVAEYTRVQAFMGATDVGVYPLLLNGEGDWKVHRFHPTLGGYFFEHFQDELYELCVRRMEGDDPRPCFVLDPECEVYRTKDLWRKAPGKKEEEGFWMMAGRVDDFVKLASLTKFNAVRIEMVLEKHPMIEKSLVGGHGRARPFVIVEMRGSRCADMSRDDVLEAIWEVFDKANEFIFDEAKLTKELVIIADPSMPLKRTGKGTVDRRNTIQAYEQQIENIYTSASGTDL